jgi:hypothetical protein
MEKTQRKCKTCSDGKQQQKKAINMGVVKVLELVYVEVVGMTRTPSLSGAR